MSARHVPQALGGNGADGRQGILDAVVKLFEDQFLQLVRRLALQSVDADLSDQFLRVNFGLRQQQPKADIFCRQKLRGMRRTL